MRHYQGQLNAQGLRFGLVVSRFNSAITQLLLDGALDCLRRHGAKEEDMAVAWVPGAFELPLAAKRMAESQKFDAVICLGAVIRGETAHFEYVSSSTASGILHASLQTDIPIIFSVLTVENIQQAHERAGTKSGNAGFNYALSAIEMVNVMHVMLQDLGQKNP